MDKFLEDRNWKKYHTPKNIAMSIAIEAAELMELFQWSNPTIDDVMLDKSLLEKIQDEIADILIYSISLGLSLDLDLFKCIMKKMEKNVIRFPPVNKK
ncbi:MAG: nucleotide pyrophosphohydrolase [Candidatus Heimdallarchaeota archaeon]|nr:nucleotide pyrophosphohydrolase [Candidatus Heimdallarchaeota archaeon]